MSIPEELIERVMSLSAEDRISLSQQLFASLPPERDPEWEEAVAAELNRRQALIDSGQAKLLSATEFIEQVREVRATRLGG